jgi:hypothetical protein
MFRWETQTVLFRLAIATLLASAIAVPRLAAQSKDENNGQDKHLDIQSSAGDLHVGSDADARKAGLPLYPGARLRHGDQDNGANLSLFTEAFGVKLVVAKYDSDDAPGKVIDYYRDKLKKYGKVIECHARDHEGEHFDADDDKDSQELKCEGDNTGPVTELKVGTQKNQHAVAIEARAGSSGSSFTLVYVHARGKQGDI